MKAKRKISTNADALVKQANLAIRRGLRARLKQPIAEWAPVWVRSDDGGVWRIERIYGGAPEVTVRIDDLPIDVRQTVEALLILLDEQAHAARCAMPIARAELEVNAIRDRARVSSVKARRGATSKAAKARAKITELVGKKRDPHKLVPAIAKYAGCTERYVRTILAGGETKVELS